MKKGNNFQVAKVQPQGDTKLFLDFFANFSLVLLTKKACAAYSKTWKAQQIIIK